MTTPLFFFIHLSVDRHLGCLHFLAVTNNTMDIHVQAFHLWLYLVVMYKFLCEPMFSGFLGTYLGVEFWSQMPTLLNILRNCWTAFHSGCIISHSYQQCTRVPVSPHCCPHLFDFFLFCLYYSYPSMYEMVLICIFLMTHRVVHLFICF